MKKTIINGGILSFGALFSGISVNADVLVTENAKILPKEIAEYSHDADYYYITFNKTGKVDIRNDELAKVDSGKDGIAQFTKEYVRVPKALVINKLYIEFDGVVYAISKPALDDSRTKELDDRRKFELFYNGWIEEHKALIDAYGQSHNYSALENLQNEFKKLAQEKFGDKLQGFTSFTPVVGSKAKVERMSVGASEKVETKNEKSKVKDETSKPKATNDKIKIENNKTGMENKTSEVGKIEKLNNKLIESKKSGDSLELKKEVETKKAGDSLDIKDSEVKKVVAQPKNPFNEKEMEELKTSVAKISHDNRYYYLEYVGSGLTQIKTDNYSRSDSPAEFSGSLARIKKTDVKDYVYVKFSGKYYYIGRDKLDESAIRPKDLSTEIEEYEEAFQKEHAKEIEKLKASGDADRVFGLLGKYQEAVKAKFGDRLEKEKLNSYFRPGENLLYGVGEKYKDTNYVTNVDEDSSKDKGRTLLKDSKKSLTPTKLGGKQLPQTGSTDIFGTIGSASVILASLLAFGAMARRKENE